MAQVNEWTWRVQKMFTQQQPSPNYVVRILWSLTGTDGTFEGTADGDVVFSLDQETQFIPYEQLTEDIVLGWVKESLGANKIAKLESGIQQKIDAKSFPPAAPESQPLPWQQS